jgi:hypothetical protein
MRDQCLRKNEVATPAKSSIRPKSAIGHGEL